jgi:hypothetical protein
MVEDKLTKKLNELGRAVKEREAAKQYQMPLWAEPERGFPNELIRSALFSASKGGDGELLEDVPIASTKDYAITYRGGRLTQADLDVFEGVMHFARGTPEGNRVVFSRHGLLKLIGRKTGNTDHKRLLKSLNCLTATAVTIRKTDASTGSSRLFWGSLLPQGAFDEETGFFSLVVNRDLAKLFDRGFTRVEWGQRHCLARKPLAKWLHLYYASHAQPFAVSVAFLMEQSGSRTEETKAFRQNLKSALGELVTIGFLAEWHITERDLVDVLKASPTVKALPLR